MAWSGSAAARRSTAPDPRSIRSFAPPPKSTASILLSGFGDDGVSGLIEIKKAGGFSMVQDPREALHGSMPCTAIRVDDVDAVLKLRELAAAIVDLANGEMVDVKPPEARAAS